MSRGSAPSPSCTSTASTANSCSISPAGWGDDFPQRTELDALLKGLLEGGQSGARFPELVACVEGDDPQSCWDALADAMLGGLDEGILPGQEGRLADLGWWCAEALHGLHGSDLDGHQLMAIARCRLLAGDISAAITATNKLLDDYEPEDEQCLHLIEALAKAAIAEGQPRQAADAIIARWEDLEGVFGGPCYEAALARLRCLAAAQAPSDELITAVELLQKADRKAFKHDLNREPLWLVVGDEPGELLDTADAADRLGRSINFVAKRLEQATIPVYRDGDQLRIPAAALDAWKAVMEHFSLLD